MFEIVKWLVEDFYVDQLIIVLYISLQPCHIWCYLSMLKGCLVQRVGNLGREKKGSNRILLDYSYRFVWKSLVLKGARCEVNGGARRRHTHPLGKPHLWCNLGKKGLDKGRIQVEHAKDSRLKKPVKGDNYWTSEAPVTMGKVQVTLQILGIRVLSSWPF